MCKTRSIKMMAVIYTSLTLMACAVGRSTNPQDPLEPMNRATFAFNQKIDTFIYRPIAKIYDFIIPNMIQHRVTLFFSNLGEVGNVGNDILQADLKWAVHDTTRFFINSTVGIFGLFDPASHIGLKKNTQDFGLTLGKWGVKDSPYFVIPFLGPSTLRDTVGLPMDYALSPIYYLKPDKLQYGLTALQKVDARAQLLSTDKLLKRAFDPYVFLRDVYSQKRKQALLPRKKPYMRSDHPKGVAATTDTLSEPSSEKATLEKPTADNLKTS